ncbi:MAG: hypothetical protein K0S06_3973 [Microvirga sp.]|jgi:hypothetical protein|nr:hypothetical protein [Microvirga sp.]
MLLTRSDFVASLNALRASTDSEERAIGENFSFEENVSDVRRDDFEAYPGSADLREAADGYFRGSVQGIVRGHIPSTFVPSLNDIALLPPTVEPTQKIVRLERIDALISSEPDLGFARLSAALLARPRDDDTLTAFVNLFAIFPGERPAFVAFKAELEPDLKEQDWLTRVIDRIGLYHYFPIEDGQTYSFALMEYTAAEVFSHARPKGLNRPFALATVLECRNNPAFFPVPRGAASGFTVDLSPGPPPSSTVREVLHVRLDYGKQHVLRFGQLPGPAAKPDLAGSRARHLAGLRAATGRDDFGT